MAAHIYHMKSHVVISDEGYQQGDSLELLGFVAASLPITKGQKPELRFGYLHDIPMAVRTQPVAADVCLLVEKNTYRQHKTHQ